MTHRRGHEFYDLTLDGMLDAGRCGIPLTSRARKTRQVN
jgi:hypothetical protein